MALLVSDAVAHPVSATTLTETLVGRPRRIAWLSAYWGYCSGSSIRCSPQLEKRLSPPNEPNRRQARGSSTFRGRRLRREQFVRDRWTGQPNALMLRAWGPAAWISYRGRVAAGRWPISVLRRCRARIGADLQVPEQLEERIPHENLCGRWE